MSTHSGHIVSGPGPRVPSCPGSDCERPTARGATRGLECAQPAAMPQRLLLGYILVLVSVVSMACADDVEPIDTADNGPRGSIFSILADDDLEQILVRASDTLWHIDLDTDVRTRLSNKILPFASTNAVSGAFTRDGSIVFADRRNDGDVIVIVRPNERLEFPGHGFHVHENTVVVADDTTFAFDLTTETVRTVTRNPAEIVAHDRYVFVQHRTPAQDSMIYDIETGDSTVVQPEVRVDMQASQLTTLRPEGALQWVVHLQTIGEGQGLYSLLMSDRGLERLPGLWRAESNTSVLCGQDEGSALIRTVDGTTRPLDVRDSSPLAQSAGCMLWPLEPDGTYTYVKPEEPTAPNSRLFNRSFSRGDWFSFWGPKPDVYGIVVAQPERLLLFEGQILQLERDDDIGRLINAFVFSDGRIAAMTRDTLYQVDRQTGRLERPTSIAELPDSSFVVHTPDEKWLLRYSAPRDSQNYTIHATNFETGETRMVEEALRPAEYTTLFFPARNRIVMSFCGPRGDDCFIQTIPYKARLE